MKALALWLVAATCVACHAVWPMQSPSTDGRSSTDAPAADALSDLGRPDALPELDQLTPGDQSPPADQAEVTDLPLTDLAPGADQLPAPDATPGADIAPPADQAAPTPDSAPGSDTGPVSPQGCIGKTVHAYSNKTMVVCESQGAVNIDQCAAAAHCASGWHMCTPAEYLARGGRTEGSGYGAWIAGCLRDGSSGKIALEPTICSTCSSAGSTPAKTVAYYCVGGSTFTLPHHYIGVVTHNMCIRLVEDIDTMGALWGPLNTGVSSNKRVVCCAP